MSNMQQLKALLQVARDGLGFYEHAVREVEDAELRGLFARMAAAKRELIDGLAARLAAHGEDLPAGGTLAGALKGRYARLRTLLAGNAPRSFVTQLEDVEDRLRQYLQGAIRQADDPQLLTQLERYLPQLRDCHRQLRELRPRYGLGATEAAGPVRELQRRLGRRR